MKRTLRRTLDAIAENSTFTVTIVAITGTTVSVRLPTGKVVSGLTVIGGSVYIGDVVTMVYLGGTPYVLAPSTQTSLADDGATSGPTVSSESSSGSSSSSGTSQHELVGPFHVASGLSINQVLKALGSTTFGFGFLSHTELIGVSANDHHLSFTALKDDQAAQVDPVASVISILGGNGISTAAETGALRINIDLDGNSIALGSNGLSVNLGSPSGLEATNGLAIADTLAGNGLLIAGKILSVDLGYGLVFSGNDIVVDPSSTPQTNEVLAADGAGGLTLRRLGINPDAGISALSIAQPGGQDRPAIRIDTNGGQAPFLEIVTGGNDYAQLKQNRDLEIITTGQVSINALGVIPAVDNMIDLGASGSRWKSLYASELIVDSLVAQSVMATVGGKIMVTPTTTLTRDLSPVDTVMYTKENPFAANDYLYMAKNGLVEALQVVSANGQTANGDYSYTVSRGLDNGVSGNFASRSVSMISIGGVLTPTVLSGATANYGEYWNTGDSVVSLQYAAGEGYIELTSTDTIHGYVGPQIVMQIRTATTNWNSSKPMLAIGNLDSYLDYAGTEYGFAVGNDLTLSPGSTFKGASLDRTNGLRLFNTPIKLYNSTLQTVDIQADGDVFFGEDISTPSKTSFVHLASAQTYNSEGLGAGDVLFGDNSSNKANLLWDRSAGKFLFRTGIDTQIEIGTDGKFYFADGAGRIGDDGIKLQSSTTLVYDKAFTFSTSGSFATELGGMYGVETALMNNVAVRVKPNNDKPSVLELYTEAAAGYTAESRLSAISGSDRMGIEVKSNSSDTPAENHIYAYAETIFIAGNKEVGTFPLAVTYPAYMFVPITPVDLIDTGNATWNGALSGKSTGTYTFDHNLYNSWPAAAKAVVLFVGAKWATASINNYANYRKASGSINEGRIMSQVNGMNDYAQVVVQCDSSGDFEVEIVGASADGCLVRMLGYYL